MKTKKLIITVAALIAAITVLSAAVLAISLPSAKPDAEPTPTPTPTPAKTTAEPEDAVVQDVNASLEGLSDVDQAPKPSSETTQATLQTTVDHSWLDEILAQSIEYYYADQARRECTHEDSIAFLDTDTDVCSAFCTFCGVIRELSETPDTAILTNTATRSTCDHEYSDWGYFNATYHIKSCRLCGNFVRETHTIVPADCITYEHCSACNAHLESWDNAYGHNMDYLFDWDDVYSTDFDYDDQLSYYHEYRCCRRDNDDVLICDYVALRENCLFREWYWDPASDGMHEVYSVCQLCGMYFFDEPVECKYAIDGYYCDKCGVPHSYTG